jgi:hypothetical protein
MKSARFEGQKCSSSLQSKLEFYSQKIGYKNVVYGKWWKREKIGNRIIIGPKVGINPVGISGDLIKTIKDLLYQWDSSNIPSTYSIQGVYKSGCLLFHDLSNENCLETADLMITHPNHSDQTGILQKFLLPSSPSLKHLPELRLETISSPEKGISRAYFHSKLSLYLLYPNTSFEVYPLKPLSLISTPLSLSLTQPTNTPTFSHGYLSLDRKGRIIVFKKDDPQLKDFAGVGVWLQGLKVPEEELEDRHLNRLEKEDLKTASLRWPEVWRVLVDYLLQWRGEMRSSSKRKNSFLLLNFLSIGGTIVPQLCEFRLWGEIDLLDNKWVVSKFKNSEHSWLSENKNLTFKFTSSETYSVPEFFAMWKPSKWESVQKKEKQISKRNMGKTSNLKSI